MRTGAAIVRTNIAHTIIALSIATASGLITWYGMQESPSSVVKAISTSVVALLAFLGFWKIPDYLFATRMDRFRMSVYRKKLMEFGLDADEAQFEIDWHGRCALLRKQGDTE